AGKVVVNGSRLSAWLKEVGHCVLRDFVANLYIYVLEFFDGSYSGLSMIRSLESEDVVLDPENSCQIVCGFLADCHIMRRYTLRLSRGQIGFSVDTEWISFTTLLAERVAVLPLNSVVLLIRYYSGCRVNEHPEPSKNRTALKDILLAESDSDRKRIAKALDATIDQELGVIEDLRNHDNPNGAAGPRGPRVSETGPRADFGR
ncbi:unnamed protein product, partial [Amoebophrya sp. A25]